MMEAETFLTPEKALEYGLIDRVDSYQADDKDVQQRLMSRVQQLSGVIAQQKSFREQLESMRQQGGEPNLRYRLQNQSRKKRNSQTS